MIKIGVLIDTGFFHGLRDEDDPNHSQSEKILENFDWNAHRPVITPSLVINETYTLMNTRSKGNFKLLQSLDRLFWGDDNFFRIIFYDSDDYRQISKILCQYSTPKKILSFVDASLIYTSQIFKIAELISFDAHFDGILTRISDI